jgi:hypothetical protein
MAAWSFHHEKVEGAGEDAEPTLIYGGGKGFMAVYDGMGGSGSERVEAEAGAETGARLAAVAAKAAVEFAAAATPDPLDEDFGRELGQTVYSALKDLDESYPSGQKIKGKLVRRFPAAFAAVAFAETHEAAYYRVFWAGDARIYAWTPKAGLQQLTCDDLVRPADAFDQLYGDSPLSNCLSAGGFKLRTAAAVLTLPAVFIAATDGCFHYLPSPFHFEYLWAETLLAADEPDEWRTFFAQKVSELTCDDASAAVAVPGASDFSTLRAAFAERASLLWNDYIQPYADEVRRNGMQIESVYRPAFMPAGDRLWKKYKKDYSALIPVAPSPPLLSEFDFR